MVKKYVELKNSQWSLRVSKVARGGCSWPKPFHVWDAMAHSWEGVLALHGWLLHSHCAALGLNLRRHLCQCRLCLWEQCHCKMAGQTARGAAFPSEFCGEACAPRSNHVLRGSFTNVKPCSVVQMFSFRRFLFYSRPISIGPKQIITENNIPTLSPIFRWILGLVFQSLCILSKNSLCRETPCYGRLCSGKFWPGLNTNAVGTKFIADPEECCQELISEKLLSFLRDRPCQ